MNITEERVRWAGYSKFDNLYDIYYQITDAVFCYCEANIDADRIKRLQSHVATLIIGKSLNQEGT